MPFFTLPSILTPQVRATAAAEEYREILGRDNFFLEIQDHGTPDEEFVRQGMTELSRLTGERAEAGALAKQLEAWRDRLLNEGDAALNALLDHINDNLIQPGKVVDGVDIGAASPARAAMASL